MADMAKLIVGFWFPEAVFLKIMKGKNKVSPARHCFYDNKLIDI